MSDLTYSIVVAFDQNSGIGKDGGLPWHLPEDLKHFKDITSQSEEGKTNVVVMGRKTWESLPEKFRPLPKRINIVLTRNKDLSLPEGVLRISAFDQILSALKEAKLEQEAGEVFIIGGQQIFEQALESKACDKIYATHIQDSFDCDTFFPPFSMDFDPYNTSDELKSRDISYYFCDYIRK